MQDYRVETTVSRDRTLILEDLPFQPGDRVEVIVRSREARAPEAAPREHDLGVEALLEAMTHAAASGQDIEPLLADLRAHLLNAAPGKEKAIDAGMEELRRQMEGIREKGLKPGQ